MLECSDHSADSRRIVFTLYTVTNSYSQQGQGFHADPQHQVFQGAPEVPQVQFCQQVPLLQLLPVKNKSH